MNRKSPTIVVLCVLILFGLTSPSAAQTPTPTPTPIDVMYTGRLFGYFRVPSVQAFDQDAGCPDISNADSAAAKAFLAWRQNNNAILVGTGDNFSPQLEARIFSGAPPRGNTYPVGNKELYFGNTRDGWTFYKDDQPDHLAKGLGTIPTDNVGCFLRAARFKAIVPGKHDFYFGAERVRQLARLLASTDAKYKYSPVQMLGANLVLKTVPIEGSAPPKIVQPGVGGWPATYPILNVQEGSSVYPWFSHLRIKLKAANAFDGKQVSLCTSSGAPNQIQNNFADCPKLHRLRVEQDGNDWILTLKLPRRRPNAKNAKEPFFSTLLPGTNYGLCLSDGLNKGCLRFSSHTPFFNFPHATPLENEDGYTDPDPFVLIDNRVAIFGVVDPGLGEQVGVLNFGFQNRQGHLTTRVSAEDPAEALEQQLEYFNEVSPDFKGLKILLAQMTPQRARALAARFPEFQIVVSGADRAQGTSEVDISTVWDPSRHKRAFLAVPAPYFNADKGTVYFSTIEASQDAAKWRLETLKPATAGYITPVPINQPTNHAVDFWSRIKKLPGCLPRNFQVQANDDPDNREYLKWLVLCSMRNHTSADVALIQEQDLFHLVPDFEAPTERLLPRAKTGQSESSIDEYMQQTLDGLIWKGDFVTLLYVPGASLKTALTQSERYRSEEKSPLSISVDRGRRLETLGIRKENGEYFINDLPLDDKKIYAVATTDYIHAGDTGYPDLVKSALNPRTHPAAFTGELVSISSLVCRSLFSPDKATRYCLSPVAGSPYLDQTTANQIPPYKSPGLFEKIWKSLNLDWPNSPTEADTRAEAVEQKVHRREIWRLSLTDFTFGFKSVNNNYTDAEIKERFGGIPTSGVTTGESRSFNISLDTRLSRSSHQREFFIAPGIDYKRQAIGDDPTEFQISQLTNRLFAETGLVFWRKPGRSWPNAGFNFSLFSETQLKRPYSVFTVASEPLKITQDRSLLLLPRLGFRWQNKLNYLEIGAQAGREINALKGFRFTTQGVVVDCLASSAETFQTCINRNSNADEGGTITVDSEVTPLLADRPRAGLYWKTNLSVSLPFTSKVKYEFEQTGDFFFVNFAQDTSVDTRIRNMSKHRLSFVIWPSLSIGPALDLLIYQNKVNRDWLFQRQFGFETKVSFDIFNRREKGVQVKHKP